jgi:hypothetical protein
MRAMGARIMLAMDCRRVQRMRLLHLRLHQRAMPTPAEQPLGIRRQQARQRHAQQMDQQCQAGEPGGEAAACHRRSDQAQVRMAFMIGTTLSKKS